ncbi:MAG: hypothetical protein IJY25_06250 [Bacilli bacterium]|nr:hypothetical protein [Bacilli bacterium]
MNNKTIYKILYYICFILSLYIWFSISNLVNIFGIGTKTTINVLLGIVNLILVVVFSINLIKKKLDNINIIFPIIHLIFSILVIIIAIIMNNKLIIPNIHFSYYMSFILFNYMLLNLYSVLSFSKRIYNNPK